MAARRLILVMLVLLVLSSAVAALIPVERDALEDTSTSTTTKATPPTGELVHGRINADRAKPKTIRIAKGDQLDLTVSSSKPGQVEILVFGVLDDVGRFAPAHIDLLPVDRGRYAVRLLPPEPGGRGARVIGRIIVAADAQGAEKADGPAT